MTKFFMKSHEWIEVNEQMGTVGISDYAKQELGDIVYVDLPRVGQTVAAGKEVCVLESTKAASDVYSPVSGKIVAVNEAFLSEMTWLYKIEVADPAELSLLLDSAAYESYVGS